MPRPSSHEACSGLFPVWFSQRTHVAVTEQTASCLKPTQCLQVIILLWRLVSHVEVRFWHMEAVLEAELQGNNTWIYIVLVLASQCFKLIYWPGFKQGLWPRREHCLHTFIPASISFLQNCIELLNFKEFFHFNSIYFLRYSTFNLCQCQEFWLNMAPLVCRSTTLSRLKYKQIKVNKTICIKTCTNVKRIICDVFLHLLNKT